MNIICCPIPPKPPRAPRRRIHWLRLTAIAAALGLWVAILFTVRSCGS